MDQERKDTGRAQEPTVAGARRAWVQPQVEELPPLIDLTLQSAIPIGGSGGPGGVSF